MGPLQGAETHAYDLARDRTRGLLTLTRQRLPVDIEAIIDLAGVPVVERVLVDGIRGTTGDVAGRRTLILTGHSAAMPLHTARSGAEPEGPEMITRTMLTDQLDLYHTRLEMTLEGVTDEEARRVMVKPLAPIVWQIGHLAVSDAIWVQRGGGSYTVQPSYNDLFKPGTGGEAAYPPLGEVWAAFSGAHQALRAFVDEADLARPLQHPAGAYSNVGGMLLYACYHRGYHIGKIGTLRALLGKPLPVVPSARR